MRRTIFNLITKLTAVATLASTIFAFAPARAANFSAMSDTMTRVKISTTADHTIVETLPAGIDFDVTGNTDVLVYDFPESSAFTQGGTWAVGDFTFNDGTARTIDAVSAGGGTTTVACTNATNNVGVAIDTTALAFRVIPCGALFTASATGATVTFTIDGTTADGTLTNPSSANTYSLALSMTDEGAASAHTGAIHLSIVDDDQVTVTATVDPAMTFDIDTAVTDTESAAPYTVALGTLTTGAVAVSGSTDSINHIWLDLDTNASGGAIVTVRNANGANGLVSTGTPGDNINSSAATMAAGTENYGLCVHSVTQTSGTLAKAGSYTAGTCATNVETNGAQALTSTDANIISTAAPLAGGRAGITVNAAISGTTAAHNDYADTLTFLATGTF